MLTWLRALDRVLRGDATSAAALKNNELDVPLWGLCVLIDALGLIYGVCMGVFALTAGGHDAWKQMLSCMIKVPALFLLTLLVTLPSLYVFNAMVGSRLTLRSVMKLLVATLAVMLAVLASIGPIVAFFSFTTTSFPFMILLNVVVFGIAGCLGMAFLLQSLNRITVFSSTVQPSLELVNPVMENSGSDEPIDPDIYDVVKTELTPLKNLSRLPHLTSGPLGHRDQKFVLFRPIGSNFFQGVIDNIDKLMEPDRGEARRGNWGGR